MKYQNIIKEVSNNLNIPIETINKAYEYYWLFIRNTIKELPLKEDLSEKEFNNLRTNFNISSLGKLYVTYDRYKRLKKEKK